MSTIPVVPAPWNLKGRHWIFVLPEISKTTSFPAGFADPIEAEALASGGEFIGGPGMIQVLSYTDSPVGPYDELAYIPGKWKYPDGSVGYRVTRIYVSSKDSVENGRRNWNIPKCLAEFKIDSSDGGVTTITVSHLGTPTPFFRVTVQPIPLISLLPIPLRSSMLPDGSFVQPPLPAGKNPEEVATTQWCLLPSTMAGILRVIRVMPGLEGGTGDGVGFPAAVPWSIGGYIHENNIYCPPSTILDIS